MQLFLAGLNRTYTLDVEKDTTIEQLGFMIQDKTCIPRHLQKLQIPRLNLWLDDTTFDTINELKLKGGDTVRIHVCQKNKNSGDRCKPNDGIVEKCAEARANPNGQLTRQRNNTTAVMKAAMETDWESIKHASSSLLGSESFLLSVAAKEEENYGWTRNPNFLQYASSALQDNCQFVEQLVRYQISSYLSATERVQKMVFKTVCDVYIEKVNGRNIYNPQRGAGCGGGKCNKELMKRNRNKLLTAIQYKNMSLVEMLIRNNQADPNEINTEGAAIIIDAAWGGNIRLVQILVDGNANVNATNMNGDTALTLAANKRFAEIIRILMDGGADRHHRNNNGRNAFDNATNGLELNANCVWNATTQKCLVELQKKVEKSTEATDSQGMYPEQKNLFTSIAEISRLIGFENIFEQHKRACNYIDVSCLLDAISGNFLRQRLCLLPVIGNCRFDDVFGVTGWWANLDQKCWLNQPWVEAILSSMKAAGRQQECVYAMHQVSSVVLQQPDFLKFIKESGIINIKFLNCYRKLYLKKRSIYDDLVTKLENEKIIVARSIALASPDIRGKCKIMSKWLQCAPSSIAHASPVLLGSKQFMTHVMELKLNETPGWSFFDASPSLMSDETFMLLGIKIHGRSALDHADISLLANLNFMRKIYANGCTIPPTFRLSEAPLSVRKDKECLVARVMVNPREVCLYASRMSLKNNICIAFSAVKINGAVLSLLPDCLKDHFNVARLAVQQDGAALSFVSARLRQNRVIVATALDVRVPELVKHAFLMACMIPCKVCPIFEKYCETVDCSGFSKTRKIMISRLMKYEHLRRSRSLLCSIGGIGRSVLMNIFEYAAFEPRRGTNILLNVDPEIASEWVEDMEAFYYAGALQSAGRVAF